METASRSCERYDGARIRYRFWCSPPAEACKTAVLELLMRRKDRVVSKKLVEDHIFGLSGDVASNAVEVYIHRLRKQLSERGAKVQIHTIRGVGYLISEDKAA